MGSVADMAQEESDIEMPDSDSRCISRELNPGHIDGNDVFYHQTTDASDKAEG